MWEDKNKNENLFSNENAYLDIYKKVIYIG